MNEKSSSALKIAIGFLHDFAAGFWAAAAFSIWWLESKTGAGTGTGAIIGQLQKQLFFIGLAATFIVLAAGGGRVFTYVDNFYGFENETGRRKMLFIKHVFLMLIFGLGTFMEYRLVF